MAAGEQYSPLANLRIEASFQGADKLVKTCGFYGFVNLFGGSVFFSQQNIFTNSPGKQEIVLKHNGDFVAQRYQVNIPNVTAVNQDVSRLYIIKTRQQVYQRGFSAAGIADKSDCFSYFYIQINIFQNRFVSDIFKINVPILYSVINGRQLDSIGLVADRRLFSNKSKTRSIAISAICTEL